MKKLLGICRTTKSRYRKWYLKSIEQVITTISPDQTATTITNAFQTVLLDAIQLPPNKQSNPRFNILTASYLKKDFRKASATPINHQVMLPIRHGFWNDEMLFGD